ncbi:MAG: glycogen/starch/alpha-glucan phosphorylase [Candidatus Margulisbacteria bacterium]|nr:glycogen/starch/alpha-glucan phosphorylase [Candidatus Margulisiibacteriota bacterium]
MNDNYKERLSDILSRKDNKDKEAILIEDSFKYNLTHKIVKDEYNSTPRDIYNALSYTIMDQLAEGWLETQRQHHYHDSKRVYYLSMEFLIGRLLKMNIDNLHINCQVQELLSKLNFDFNTIEDMEEDAGLGNGGLGRLAACFLESMATLNIPSFGYGIRYDYGLFKQDIENGWQIEKPDKWLENGYPWEIPRSEKYTINFYGHVEKYNDKDGKEVSVWKNCNKVFAVPYDIPVPGFNNKTVNTLRLWSAKSDDEFKLQIFNNGDFVNAYEEKLHDENITKILYPNDNVYAGQELRLKQEYFFCAASLQDIIRRFKENETHELKDIPSKIVIQLNDTHPAIAIPELVRILIDEEHLSFDEAWEITKQTFAYTNHTLLPEALEKWPERMFAYMLPRHLEIIYLINTKLMTDIQIKFGPDMGKMRKMSIIEEGSEKMVRMAYLAVAGSFSVNGVSALHSELIKSELMPEFYMLYPEKFKNKTNGITPRRWLYKCNSRLSELITSKIGTGWITNLTELKKLTNLENKEYITEGWEIIKTNNKKDLSNWLEKQYGFSFDPNSLVDVQTKRIHEYKRQLLNVMHVIHLYLQLKKDPNMQFTPRTVLIGGKAAPAYHVAKLYIKLVNNVAKVINNDPKVKDKLKLFFIPNYNVTMAEKIMPAADLSEQISTAGKEASGTGNMKFALNGALTIGTLDGANVEIKEEVGSENIYIFGLTAEEVSTLQKEGYDPRKYLKEYEPLQEILELIRNGFFSPEQPDLFYPIYSDLVNSDPYMIMADFKSYVECQEKVSADFLDRDLWIKKSIENVANIGKFSSDRTIAEYNWDIWKVTPVEIK